MLRFITTVAASLLLMICTIACGGGGGNGTGGSQGGASNAVSAIITPANTSIPLGLTQQFTYTLSAGLVRFESATWQSSNPAVATIDNTGLATSKGQGTTTITVSQGTATGSATLTVGPPVPVSVSIQSSAPLALVGQQLQLSALTTYTDSSLIDETSVVAWTSSDDSVAGVDSSGKVSARSFGSAIIGVTRGTITDSVGLRVTGTSRVVFVKYNRGELITTVLDPTANVLRTLRNLPVSLPISSIAGPFTIDPKGRFIYFSTGLPAIYGYKVSADASLEPIAGMPVARSNSNHEYGDPAIDPTGRYMYYGGANGIIGFAIDASSGALTQIPNLPTTALDGHPMIGFDTAGKYLFTSNQYSPGLYVYRIGEGGKLTSVAGSPFSVPKFATVGPYVHPSGRFVYYCGGDSSKTVFTKLQFDPRTEKVGDAKEYRFDIDGNVGSLDPRGDFLYMTTFQPGQIHSLRIDSKDGSLSLAASLNVGSTLLGLLTVDAAGDYVYENDYLATYKVNHSTGALQPVFGVASDIDVNVAPIPSATAPSLHTTDLYIANRDSDSIGAYRLDSTGHLTFGDSFTSAAIARPISLTADRNKRRIFVGSSGTHSISALDINASSGALSLAGSADGGSCPVSMAEDRYGATLSVADRDGSYWLGSYAIGGPETISANGSTPLVFNPPCEAPPWTPTSAQFVGVTIAPISRGFTLLDRNDPTYAGKDPVAFVYHPSGRYLYVVNRGDNTLRVISTSLRSGDFQPAYTEVATGNRPSAIAADPLGQYIFVANAGDNTVAMYSIEISGVPQVMPNPAATGSAPVALSVDETGHWLFAVASESNEIWSFEIDRQNGTLRHFDTVPTGEHPVAITSLQQIR